MASRRMGSASVSPVARRPNCGSNIRAGDVVVAQGQVGGSYSFYLVLARWSEQLCNHDPRCGNRHGPKPDKRNTIRRLGPERQQHHLLEYLIHSSVDGPLGKRKLIPPSETPFLNMLSDAHRQERPDQVICFGQRLSLQPVAVGVLPRIQLVT